MALINFGEAKTEYLRDTLGSNELAVDGRTNQGGPFEFTYTVPTGWIFFADRITFTIVDNGNLNAERFGAVSALSVGVDLEQIVDSVVENMLNGLNDNMTLTQNADFAKLVGDNITEFGNRRGLVADWRWDGDQVQFLPDATILARVNDNLSRLVSFTIALKGRLVELGTPPPEE